MLSFTMLKSELLWLETSKILFILLFFSDSFREIIMANRALNRIRSDLHYGLKGMLLSRFHSIHTDNVVVKISCSFLSILLLDKNSINNSLVVIKITDYESVFRFDCIT